MADDFSLYGHDLFGEPIRPASRGPLADRFLVPPFSILNAREGFWQDRKRAWLSLGIKSEVGRAGGLCYNVNGWTSADGSAKAPEQSDTSIFDPVLTEAMVRWFCPPGGRVLDPFAGGSVRGIVAGCLGRDYYGVDLRTEQVEANRQQAERIKPTRMPTWVAADSLSQMADAPEADFIFSCPPYGDLEVYSDDPRDLSTMSHDAFLGSYATIIYRAMERLKPNSFAAFVVGDFRDARGLFRNFVSDTISAFRIAGGHLYNEMILITPAGSLPIRASKQFVASRKIGKTHQNVLVFVKGDPRAAAQACQSDDDSII